MSFFSTSDSSTYSSAYVPCEQWLELHLAEIHQKLNDLIYKDQVNQLWKLGTESILHSILSKVYSQNICVSTSCQTDELLEEGCDTLVELPTHFNETSGTLLEEETELNHEELHNGIEDISDSSPSAHENEISAFFAYPEQPIKRRNANGGDFGKSIRFCSDRQKENASLNEISQTRQEQDIRVASSVEEENEFNGQRDVFEVIPPSFSSVHENQISASGASPEQPTQSANMSRSNAAKFYQCSRCESKFLSKAEISRHERTHVKPSFQCDSCLQVFTIPGFARHRLVCSFRPNENGSFECPQCEKLLESRDQLYRHLWYHREKVHIKHHCSVCGRGFPFASSLAKHMASYADATSLHRRPSRRIFRTKKVENK